MELPPVDVRPGERPVDTDYVKRISSGEDALPTLAELDRDIQTARTIERGGVELATYRRIEQLNREVDRGSDAAIRELQEIRKNLPDEGEPNSPGVDVLRQLRAEYEALERQGGESVATLADGLARVLKRYISDYTNRDPFARAIFRKAFEEAGKAGIDTRKLGNDVIDRYLADLSFSDKQFMREEFAKFTRPKLEGPAAKLTPREAIAQRGPNQTVGDVLQQRPEGTRTVAAARADDVLRGPMPGEVPPSVRIRRGVAYEGEPVWRAYQNDQVIGEQPNLRTLQQQLVGQQATPASYAPPVLACHLAECHLEVSPRGPPLLHRHPLPDHRRHLQVASMLPMPPSLHGLHPRHPG